ncbi:MAG: helix-turn-helix domain-containing protein [Sporomusaceae bacterium]|nr:helix-turn-helix domain-containing protein [Sporomusaceae bacterium]
MACFTDRLNELFEEARDRNYPFSRVDYAKFLGVTHNQVSGWLDGRSEPSIKMLRHIARSHNVSLSWLVGDTNIKQPECFQPAAELIARMEGMPPQALDIIGAVIEMTRFYYRKSPAAKCDAVLKTSSSETL